MIINTMMNVDPATAFVSPGIQSRVIEGVTNARNLFDRWALMVRSYDAQGLVDWNFKTTKPADHLNSTWTPIDMNGFQWGQDDVFLSNPSVYPVSEIKFSSPSGALYEINRRCGNITGEVNPLPDFDVLPVLQSGLGTPPAGGNIHPGQPYVLRSGAWNSTGTPAQQTYLLTVPAGVTPVAPYDGGSWDPAARTITWSNVAIPVNGFGSAVFKDLDFTVTPGTPSSALSFNLTVGPVNLGGSNRSTSISYNVQNERMPAVQGLHGDIHAGGGLCGLSSGSGLIKGNPKSDSGGQYVVSASSDRIDFASNDYANVNGHHGNGYGHTDEHDNADNGSNGSSILGIGSSGQYDRVCRPDLVQAAQDYVSSGGAFTAVTDPTFSLADKSGVYVYTGAGTINVSGVVNNKTTLVSTRGNVRFNGSVTINNAVRAARDAPSLGVIAAGNIEIPANVNFIEAYLFSNDTINTCIDASSACSSTPLIVNGFLMGKTLSLHRLGPAGTQGSQIAEKITLNPQIYINPPALFDSGTALRITSGLGERPPLQ
jgi:hypothetical protein